MDKIIVFGGGYRGETIIEKIRGKIDNTEIVAVVDNYKTGFVKDIKIIKPKDILNTEYDYIVLATQKVDEAIVQLTNLGVEYFKIVTSFLINTGVGAREVFLNNIAKEIYRKGIQGCVAEAGVLRGEFAAQINSSFRDRKLYL